MALYPCCLLLVRLAYASPLGMPTPLLGLLSGVLRICVAEYRARLQVSYNCRPWRQLYLWRCRSNCYLDQTVSSAAMFCFFQLLSSLLLSLLLYPDTNFIDWTALAPPFQVLAKIDKMRKLNVGAVLRPTSARAAACGVATVAVFKVWDKTRGYWLLYCYTLTWPCGRPTNTERGQECLSSGRLLFSIYMLAFF